jgi:hypothetical protein
MSTATIGRGLLALLLVALPASAAGSARTAGSFAELDAIDVSVEIGGPLDVAGGASPELLVGDLARFNRFETGMKRGVGAKLESCGILWDEGAVDEVAILVYGRPEAEGAGSDSEARYVYMVQARVLNRELAGGEGKGEWVTLRPVIGIADDAGLEQALIDTAVAIVGGELGSCDGPDGG